MNYISNRNYGCRMKEISIKGHRALIIENNLLNILILLDKGADIIEFTYKKTDTDFMWQAPAGLDLLTFDKLNQSNYTGGWFEAFPNVGEGCHYNGIELPLYGDVYKLPWEYQVLEDEPDVLKLKLFVKSYVLPFYLEKILTLKENIASLHIEERVKNISRNEMHFIWGHHPNIGRPFLNEDCVIDLPGGDISFLKRTADGSVEEANAGKWPYKDEEGTLTDLRRIPSPAEGQNDLLLFSNMGGSWAAVRDPKKGIGFALTWDDKVFKNMALWRAFASERWQPIFGHSYILCFLLKSSHHTPLTEAILHNEQLTLQPGEWMSTWLAAAIFEGKYEGGTTGGKQGG